MYVIITYVLSATYMSIYHYYYYHYYHYYTMLIYNITGGLFTSSHPPTHPTLGCSCLSYCLALPYVSLPRITVPSVVHHHCMY